MISHRQTIWDYLVVFRADLAAIMPIGLLGRALCLPPIAQPLGRRFSRRSNYLTSTLRMRRRELSVIQVLLIYVLGLMAGTQAALFLYDTFDDGVSEPLSGVIALGFIAAGLGVIGWWFRKARA